MLLKNRYKQMLLNIFSEVSMPLEVWAYGSIVKGDAHEGSDLDLIVLAPDRKKLPVEILMELKEKIRESNVPILVDLFDWARLPESFHKNIEACHEVFYTSSLQVMNDPKSEYNKKIKEDNKQKSK